MDYKKYIEDMIETKAYLEEEYEKNSTLKSFILNKIKRGEEQSYDPWSEYGEEYYLYVEFSHNIAKEYDEYKRHLLQQIRYYSDKIAIMSSLMFALKELQKTEITPVDCSPKILISDEEFDIYDWYEMADPEKGLDIDRETYEENYGPRTEIIYVWD